MDFRVLGTIVSCDPPLCRRQTGVIISILKKGDWNSMAVQWVRLCPLTAQDLGPISGQGTKITQDVRWPNNKIRPKTGVQNCQVGNWPIIRKIVGSRLGPGAHPPPSVSEKNSFLSKPKTSSWTSYLHSPAFMQRRVRFASVWVSQVDPVWEPKTHSLCTPGTSGPALFRDIANPKPVLRD